MKTVLSFAQIGLAIVAASGFAGSTWAFRKSLDTGDHRWMIGAIAVLILSYIPYLTLLAQSMSMTIVVTSMMSQIIALTIAFAVYGEPITRTHIFGLAAAIIAVVAFALVTPNNP